MSLRIVDTSLLPCSSLNFVIVTGQVYGRYAEWNDQQDTLGRFSWQVCDDYCRIFIIFWCCCTGSSHLNFVPQIAWVNRWLSSRAQFFVRSIETSEMRPEKFHTDDIACTAKICVVISDWLLLVKIQNQAKTNQRHYTDLCRVTSSEYHILQVKSWTSLEWESEHAKRDVCLLSLALKKKGWSMVFQKIRVSQTLVEFHGSRSLDLGFTAIKKVKKSWSRREKH